MKLRRLALVVVPVVALVACGGDDGGGGSAFGDPVTEQSEAGGDSSGDPSGDTSGDGGDSSGDYVMPTNECIEASLAMLSAIGLATEDPTALYDLPAQLSDLRGNLPDDVVDDLDVVIAEFQRYGDILQSYDGDMMTAFADPELQTIMTSDEYLAANERLNAWFETECGS